METNTGEPIRLERWIIEHIESTPKGLAAAAAKEFGCTRQAVNRVLRRLVTKGKLWATGNTKSREYKLVELSQVDKWLQVEPDLQEDTVWRVEIAPLLADLPQNVRTICQFGFTEMLNNVIDHAECDTARIEMRRTAASIELSVGDFGVGIFNKIKEVCHLEDTRHAILELSKGKLTTDPEAHSGEGVFFTSRMFDQFRIFSGDLCLVCVTEGHDWLIELETPSKPRAGGTLVEMSISPFSERTVQIVWNRFAEAETDGFLKTIVPVKLAKYGPEQLISRSQAKRLLNRFNRFREVMLDFEGVEMIGQAFADEIFRVFALNNPSVHLEVINVDPQVQSMIRHVLAESRSNGDSEPSALVA